MNLKSISRSLLDLLRISKGKKVEEPVVIVPLPPLMVRLQLSPLPEQLTGHEQALFVRDEIAARFPRKVSRRVLKKIAKYYGVDLRGHGFFKAIPDRPTMLAVV
ncbi:MAG: hypothetical protein HZB99_03865 [Candidatus Harrisonbacteria bacterium]|nr:hypothetical protein [Candidatus Harrisonbacteria bacterium]